MRQVPNKCALPSCPISVFAVLLKTLWILVIRRAPIETLIWVHGFLGWSESSLGHMSSVNTSVDSSTLTLWPCSFPGCLVSFYFWFVEIYELNANSVDPDQMSRSAASDLGLHFCRYPIYGTLGLYGFRHGISCSITSYDTCDWCNPLGSIFYVGILQKKQKTKK